LLKKESYARQQVLLFNLRLKLFPGKLKFKWSRPFIIKKVKPFGAVELVEPSSFEPKRSWIVYGQRLKSYNGKEFERLMLKKHLLGGNLEFLSLNLLFFCLVSV